MTQNFIDGDPAVHRVCEVIKGDCRRCPASETVGRHEDTTRACYLQARECVNTVETGNPWRKKKPRKPFVYIDPMQQHMDGIRAHCKDMKGYWTDHIGLLDAEYPRKERV